MKLTYLAVTLTADNRPLWRCQECLTMPSRFTSSTPLLASKGRLAGMHRVMTPFSDYGLPVGTTRLELVIAPAHRGIISELRFRASSRRGTQNALSFDRG